MIRPAWTWTATLQDRLIRLGADVEIVRLALTVEQIEHHNLLPQPTKRGDSRARRYSADHDGSWELDALPAAVLSEIVSDGIDALAPDDLTDRQAGDYAARERLLTLAATA